MLKLAPRARDEVTQRLAASKEEREDTNRHIAMGQIWKADTPERVEKRKVRLLTEPSIASNLSPQQREILASVPLSDAPEDILQAFETQIGGKDTQPCWFLTRGAEVRRSIGRIHIRDANRRIGWGTGFLVAPNLLLTNQHVLNSMLTARFSRVEFDYEDTYDGDILPSAIFDLNPETLFLSDPARDGMDYALVAVAARSRADGRRTDAELAEFGYNPLVREEGKLLKGESINCIHHPEGQGRQLCIRGNRLMALSAPALQNMWMHYETDTEPGSSGAPLFNNQWEVVGIHHRSAAKLDEQGRTLAIGGGLWTPEMGARQVWWYANEGLRISCFITHVETQLQAAQASDTPATPGRILTEAGIALVEQMLTPSPIRARPIQPLLSASGPTVIRQAARGVFRPE